MIFLESLSRLLVVLVSSFVDFHVLVVCNRLCRWPGTKSENSSAFCELNLVS